MYFGSTYLLFFNYWFMDKFVLGFIVHQVTKALEDLQDLMVVEWNTYDGERQRVLMVLVKSTKVSFPSSK